jgi:8-oxo-dGTP diphosphatase
VGHTYRYPRPSLTVDCVIFGFEAISPSGPTSGDEGGLSVLLIRRKAEPFAGSWAIPGGFVEVSDTGSQGESLEAAARRELEEETGISVAYLEQLYTFGAPGRDPRGRVVSVAYVALVRPGDHRVAAGSDAADAAWFPVEAALSGHLGPLAFDHATILRTGLERLRGKIRYSPIGFNLLPPRFTLGVLRRLYEVLLGQSIDAANFHKKVDKALVKSGVLIKTRHTQKGQHRPAPLYQFDARAYEKAVQRGFYFEL